MLHGLFKSICRSGVNPEKVFRIRWGATQVYHQPLNRATQYLRRFSQDPPGQSNLSFHAVHLLYKMFSNCYFIVIKHPTGLCQTKGFSVFFWIILSHEVSRLFPTRTHTSTYAKFKNLLYIRCTLADILLQCLFDLIFYNRTNCWIVWPAGSGTQDNISGWLMFLCSPNVTKTLYYELSFSPCKSLKNSDFSLNFWSTHVLLWGHWYSCFGLLVMSLLGFPYLHLCCDTCQPLYSQHVAVPHMRVSAEVGCRIGMGHLPLADPKGFLGTPPRSKLFHFHAVFGKKIG